MEDQLKQISLTQWIAWIMSTGIAAAMLTVFFYTNFQTKAEASAHQDTQIEILNRIERRIDRIEEKLDKLSERG